MHYMNLILNYYLSKLIGHTKDSGLLIFHFVMDNNPLIVQNSLIYLNEANKENDAPSGKIVVSQLARHQKRNKK